VENKLEPHWAGAVSLITLLYGYWPLSNIFSGGEYNLMAGLLIGPFIFSAIALIVAYFFGWALILIKQDLSRLCLVLTAIIIFLFGYGIPSLTLLGIAACFFCAGYYRAKRVREDTADLKAFLDKHHGD
jgi:cell division protein FtsW (lipid II flippase)